MDATELKHRTRAFALQVIELVDSVPTTQTGRVSSGQLLRAVTSVGADYRAACRAKFNADFISKMGAVEEEAGGTLKGLGLLEEAGLVRVAQLGSSIQEADEPVASVVASINTARRRQQQPAIRAPHSALRNHDRSPPLSTGRSTCIRVKRPGSLSTVHSP